MNKKYADAYNDAILFVQVYKSNVTPDDVALSGGGKYSWYFQHLTWVYVHSHIQVQLH